MKKKVEEPENHERWLISYADFITLLMVFFVVLYAMSQVDVAKYEQMASSLNAAFSGGTGVLNDPSQGIGPDNNGVRAQPTPSETSGGKGIDSEGEGEGDTERESMKTVEGRLKTYFADHGLSAEITTSIDERGLVVSLNDTMLFDLGSADIKLESRQRLVSIGEALNALENYIRVEGHTDNLPIHSERFASNWELSAMRATTVVRLMADSANVPPDKLSAVGYGEYKPIADNSTNEGRAANRRVDIILLSSRYNKLED
ncbi:MAG: OmpA family protein [Clostridiales bacterium]|jgi:chemotaxis protein MotB|nr:OmpA family protein [Clostridiales bacterium]